jgi:hypothetical protein
LLLLEAMSSRQVMVSEKPDRAVAQARREFKPRI